MVSVLRQFPTRECRKKSRGEEKMMGYIQDKEFEIFLGLK